MWHSPGVDAAALKDLARDQLGRQAAFVGFEIKQHAGALEPGEEPRTFAMGMLGRRGRLVLLTDRRLLLARGWSPIPRSSRVDAWPLDELTDVERHTMSSTFTFGERGSVGLMLAPEEASDAIIGDLRARLGRPDAEPAREDLAALAQRKLGGKLAYAVEHDLAKVADRLGPDEEVQRLAFVSDEDGGLLLALTAERMMLAHAAVRAGRDRWLEWPREDVRAVARDGIVLVVEAGDETLHLGFASEDRCDELEAVLR